MVTFLFVLCTPFCLWAALALLLLGLEALASPKGGLTPQFTLRNLWVIMRHIIKHLRFP